MSLADATDKVKALTENHGGKLKSKVKFSFPEGAIHLDDTVEPTSVTNEDQDADCTIVIQLDDFDKLMSGDLNPMMAFMTGKMKVEGDKAIAMKLSSMF
ncbi:MAG: SCP2 sterol-binding domain-containing protein [Cytophagales bacterium]|nr:SCP2 sterol-binding domain-containing protein [Cytophagales bacterium]